MPGHDPILFDIGTGARYFGVDWPAERRFAGTCLLSHFHWDHIQGLPFFPPLLLPGNTLDVHAPTQDGHEDVPELIARMLRPPLFPVGLEEFPGDVSYDEHGDEAFRVGEVEVMARLVPHLGNTLGYRLSWGGRSVVYLSDHQQPVEGRFEATENARELCDGADVLIHDAQFTREEFAHRPHWGHCSTDFAVWLAVECDVEQLVLFHHDPAHTDEQIDRIVAEANRTCADLHVVGASEGLTLRIGP